MVKIKIGLVISTEMKKLLGSHEFARKQLGEVIEITTNQYGISLFSSLISLIAIGVYTLLTVDTGNDDDDSDSGSGGLMQPIS
tara:strand:+ start:33 stop:281 length:249 start_codon:yes stop_codon:yes gene_type:complete